MAKMLSAETIAAQTDFSRKTVKKWIDSGCLEAKNFGTEARPIWRVKQETLDQFIESMPANIIPVPREHPNEPYTPPPGIPAFITPDMYEGD